MFEYFVLSTVSSYSYPLLQFLTITSYLLHCRLIVEILPANDKKHLFS